MQVELWELFNAYYTCRGNKRNTHNALSFEVDYENNLVKLCNDINNNHYKIGRSIAFIVKNLLLGKYSQPILETGWYIILLSTN